MKFEAKLTSFKAYWRVRATISLHKREEFKSLVENGNKRTFVFTQPTLANFTMFNVNITGEIHGSAGTIIIPKQLFESAVSFYKSRLYARNITPSGKRFVLLESGFGFRVKIERSASSWGSCCAYLTVASSSGRKRIAKALSANGRYNERSSVCASNDPFGVMWTISST